MDAVGCTEKGWARSQCWMRVFFVEVDWRLGLLCLLCKGIKKIRTALQMEGFMTSVGDVMMSMKADSVLFDCNICQITEARKVD